MNFMTDRSPTLLFNFRTQNPPLAFCKRGSRKRLPGASVAALTGLKRRKFETRIPNFGFSAGCLCAGAGLHQPQTQHIQSRKKGDDQQDAFGLSVNKSNQSVRIRQKLRLEPVSFVTEISQNPTPESRSRNRYETEKSEVHPNNARRNRNQMPNHGEEPCKKDPACFVASQPLLGLLQFFSASTAQNGHTLRSVDVQLIATPNK